MKKNHIISIFLIFSICTRIFGGIAIDAAVIEAEDAGTEQSCSYIPDGITVERIGQNGVARLRAADDIPTAYNAVEEGQVTSVKQQKPWGMCWAFSALSAAESSLISQNEVIDGVEATAENTDLSERHLAYFLYHTVEDELGNTEGDKTEDVDTSYEYLDVGGNNVFTTFAFANWIGAADEGTAPYISSNNVPDLDSSLAYNAVAHMENAYWINVADTEQIKSMIMQYGGVSSAYYHATTYLNSGNGAYYCNLDSSEIYENHGITIVGWDDNYAAENFKTEPSADGAWLAKNSWGESWGADGYFWLSYEDAILQKEDTTAFVFDFQSSDVYDHNYHYDGSAGYAVEKVRSGTSFANVFTTAANPDGREALKAVSFGTGDTNISYSIQIYKNPNNGEPDSGTPLLSSAQTGSMQYAGYYTIPLEESVILEEGETFSVVVTFTSSTGSQIQVFVDESYTNGSWIAFTNATAQGQSYRYSTSKRTWNDLHTSGITARIKAYTTDIADDGMEREPTAATEESEIMIPTEGNEADNPIENPTNSSTETDSTVQASVETEVTSVYNENTAQTVKNITATAKSTSKVYLTWKKCNKASGYEIYRYNKSRKKYVRIALINKSSQCIYIDKGRQAGTKYRYKIRSFITGEGNTAYSKFGQTVSVTTKTKAPKIKAFVTDVSQGAKITLKWNKVKGAKGYRITIKKKGAKKVKKVLVSAGTRRYVQVVKKDNTCYYTVQAYVENNGKKVYSKKSNVKNYR